MPPNLTRPIRLAEPVIAALMRERARFQRFLVRRIGAEATAEDILQASLLRALQRGDSLRQGENATAWFYRILRRAIADHFRQQHAERRRLERYAAEFPLVGNDHHARGNDWDTAICRCFEGLLPALPPRYAELIRRIDLNGELRPLVAHELKLSAATLDVTLHRARRALRRQLEIFCGACSREACLRCAAGCTSVNLPPTKPRNPSKAGLHRAVARQRR